MTPTQEQKLDQAILTLAKVAERLDSRSVQIDDHEARLRNHGEHITAMRAHGKLINFLSGIFGASLITWLFGARS